MVQWLGHGVFTAEGPGSILGQGTKILQTVQHIQKINYKLKKKFSKEDVVHIYNIILHSHKKAKNRFH